MKINVNGAGQTVEYLSKFAAGEKPAAVDGRTAEFQQILAKAGYNLTTRTTKAALLALVLGGSTGAEAPAKSAADYIKVKPEMVKARIQEFKKLVLGTGRTFTRTTCAALVHLGEDNYPEK